VELYPKQINLSQEILLLESLPCDSIDLVNRANEDNRCVSCVCVCVFIRFVCHVHRVLCVHPLPRHKSRESVKIGPHPIGVLDLQVLIYL
jgi:hypothetical protein